MDKILVYSTKKEIHDLITDILGKSVSVKPCEVDEALKDLRNFQFILADCDYNCSFDHCQRKFIFLFQNRHIPFAIIRPLCLKERFKEFLDFFLSTFKILCGIIHISYFPL